MHKRASSFMDYVIAIGVVSALLAGMNIYIKRGLQARLKDMTDHFVSAEQATDVTPVQSAAKSEINTDTKSVHLLGGGAQLASREQKQISAQSRVEEQRLDIASGSADTVATDVSRPEGQGQTPAAGKPDWQAETNVETLRKLRDDFQKGADSLDRAADQLKNGGQQVIKEAHDIDCDDEGDCEAAVDAMIQKGQGIIAKSADQHKTAKQMRDDAQSINARIEQLTGKPEEG